MVDYRIDHAPAYSILKLYLRPGETVVFEAGAFIYSRGPLRFQTRSMGVGAALKRALLGGESFFLNMAVAEGDSELWLAPDVPGDIAPVEVQGQLLVQDTSYLAHTGSIRVTTAWRGLRGWLAEGEFFWLKLEGHGQAWLSAYGSIDRVDLAQGERILVDNHHLVAMDHTIRWTPRKFGGFKSFIFGGEGIVFELEGPGRVWIQSRRLPGLAEIISKFLPGS